MKTSRTPNQQARARSGLGAQSSCGLQDPLAAAVPHRQRSPKTTARPAPAGLSTIFKPAPTASKMPAKVGVQPNEGDEAKHGDATAPDDDIGRMARLGFTRLAECLLTIPKTYCDYSRPILRLTAKHLVGAGEGKGASAYLVLRPVALEVFDSAGNPARWGRYAMRLDIQCLDAANTPVRVVVFGQVHAWKPLADAIDELGPEGLRGSEFETLHVYGKLKIFRKQISLQDAHRVPAESRGKVIPVYAGKQGQVSGETVADAVKRAMPRFEETEILMLAQAGLRENEFAQVINAVPLPAALPEIRVPADLLDSLHLPNTVAEGNAASQVARRLSAEAVVRTAMMARSRRQVTASSIAISNSVLDELVGRLPFPLTGDQSQALAEIVADLRGPFPMNRLLSGDVGTGKSITFMVPAVAAAMSGVNVAILVPSQLLVSQHTKELSKFFPGLGPGRLVEVTGGTRIDAGAPPGRIFVGTTALLSVARKARLKFGLCIVDEQHKFSVEQKTALCHDATNCLEATATAIPRSLALVNFGGLDVSILRQCPVQKNITTRIVSADDEARVQSFVAEVVRRGGQAAVIYPLVEAVQDDGSGSEGAAKSTAALKAREGLQSVIQAGDQWDSLFPGRVAVLHSKLSPEQKDDVIRAMNEGRIDVLVSSLVIEVGVTLPSLKAIVVNHADRFGLAQLHQLRGRVARKGGRGYVFLMADQEDFEAEEAGGGEALARMRLLERYTDGFSLAEADMDQRGFGDVAQESELQSGSARTLFHNAKLTHGEIVAAAKRMGAQT